MSSSYKAPLSDIRFALHDVLGADALFARLGFDDTSAETVDAVLDEAARFAETVLAPLNAVGDREGWIATADLWGVGENEVVE